jgi:N-acetylmuramoyl-L-alanine amidase
MYGYDAKKQEPYFRAAWKNAVDLCVHLCKEFHLTEQNIICHSEGYKLGVASNSGDVMHWLPKYGESMDTFRAAVRAALKPSVITKPEEPEMTQEQFDAMFKVAMERYNKDLTALPPSNWAKDNWERMVTAGMFDGTSPRAPLSREQAATLFAKLRS